MSKKLVYPSDSCKELLCKPIPADLSKFSSLKFSCGKLSMFLFCLDYLDLHRKKVHLQVNMGQDRSSVVECMLCIPSVHDIPA